MHRKVALDMYMKLEVEIIDHFVLHEIFNTFDNRANCAANLAGIVGAKAGNGRNTT